LRASSLYSGSLFHGRTGSVNDPWKPVCAEGSELRSDAQGGALCHKQAHGGTLNILMLPLGTHIDCLLVADDLTGACDAAVHFAIRGLRPVTVLVARGTPASGARVIAVSTESRDLPPSEIRNALLTLAAEFPADSVARVFKKIDSTMRGNTGLEIAAALDAFDCDAAVVCPAFPKLHRVVVSGFLRVTTAPEFEPIDVAGRLQAQAGQACAHTRPDGVAAILADGACMVSVDANCDDDLDRIAAAILPMGRRILWAGSAGLASALARGLGEECPPQFVPSRTGAVLFCIGSDHSVTLAQQSALLAERSCVLLHPDADTRESICESLVRGQHVVLRIPRGLVWVERVRERIDGAPAAALVLSGGDTASLVCRAAGVQSIELCDEIVPGVPRGILHGGEFDGVAVATKSGGFGDRDTLVQVADFFHARTEH
jgi:D-threonate/D-erythronate kinase